MPQVLLDTLNASDSAIVDRTAEADSHVLNVVPVNNNSKRACHILLSCLSWKEEKEIVMIRAKENILFKEA